MALGFGILRLSPSVLWSMTLKELAAAAKGALGPAPPAPPSRADLDALIARYPQAQPAPPRQP